MPTRGGIVTAGKRGGANNKTVKRQSACPLVMTVARGRKSRRANGGKTATGKEIRR